MSAVPSLGFRWEHYGLSFFLVEEYCGSGHVETHIMRSRYYAISIFRLCELMQKAGFEKVRRLDGAFYQPMLIGTKPADL